MKVKTSWGSKFESRTKIDGDTLENVHRRLDVLPEWGAFKGTFGDVSWDDDAKATAVEIKPSYSIRMPVWTKCSTQPKTCQAEWNRMWKALRLHEENHRDIFLKGLAGFESKLKALKIATGAQIKQLMAKAVSDIEAAHKAYDNTTQNGKKEGVRLAIAKECSISP